MKHKHLPQIIEAASGRGMHSAADSYSTIAQHYNSYANKSSFWERLARAAYEGIDLKVYKTGVDVGCGTGLAIEFLGRKSRDGVRIVGIEPAERMRSLAKERVAQLNNVDVLAGEFESIPLPDASVDYLYSIWAFHWVHNPSLAVKELQRVLKTDAELDLWFVGWNTGREFAQAASRVLGKYVNLEERIEAASVLASFDRRIVEDLFSFLDRRGLMIEEETVTHFDTFENHWAWQIRSEAHYAVVPNWRRAEFDAELKDAIRSLGDERGIPYTRHSFHLRYRHLPASFFSFTKRLEKLPNRPPLPSAVICSLGGASDESLQKQAVSLRQ